MKNLITLRFLWLAFSVVLLGAIPSQDLFAQADDVLDNPGTKMTIDSGDAITDTGEDPNNNDVVGDLSYAPPQGPFQPDLPDTNTNYEGPVGVTGIFNGNISTACSYDPLSHSAHRVVDDIVVPGSIGKYPLKMTRYYNSRQQYYATPGAIGLSPGWAHEYSWLLWSAGSKVVSPHGSVYDDYCGSPVGVSEGWDTYLSVWRLADGGKVVFSSGRVTDIYDPYGQRTRIAYDANGQRVKVTEPGGRCLWFTYSDQDPDGTKLLTWVQAYDIDGSPGTPTLPTGNVIGWVNYTYSLVSPGVPDRKKKMLTGANYSDGTSASYQYRTDNVHEGPTSHKMYPLLKRCNDVRYSGPMRTIWYEYQNDGPHGAITNEKYPGIGAISAIAPGLSTNGTYIDGFTETRGNNDSRSFNYTHIQHCQGPECGPCDDQGTNGPNQQMLLNYTDFNGHATYLGYDANWYINSVRDVNNHTTTYTRGPRPPTGIGQITRITHPDTTYIDYTYYNEGNGHIGGHYINMVTDERGNVTLYSRDGNYRVTSIDYKDNQNNVLAHEEFVYNGFGQVTRQKLKNGNYVHYQYDARGLLLSKWNPTSHDTAQQADPKTTYSYYGSGPWRDRVYRETLPTNVSGYQAIDGFEYDRDATPQGHAVFGRGSITKIGHIDGTYRSFGFNQFGYKVWEENELSQRTSFAYDNYNRLRTTTDPMSHTARYDYSPIEGNTTQCYFHTTNSAYFITSGAGIKTHNTFDPNFNKLSSTVGYQTAAAATTSFVYDYVGNPTWVTDPLSRNTRNTYDNRNRKTSTTEAYGTNVQASTVWHYDGASNINQIDRPDGRHEYKGYDGLNRMIWNNVPQSPDVSLTTWFGYNPSGTLQWVRDANVHVTNFDYDASDRKKKMTYPGGSQFQSWNFDNAGNLSSRTTVGGKTQNFTYDSRNRKTGMTWSNGADSATYGYDAANRLTSATNTNSTITRTYYADGRLEHDLQAVVGGPSKQANYVYDGDGNITWTNVSPADNPSYNWDLSYDGMGRLNTISPHGASAPFQYQYDAASNVIHRYTYLSGSVTIDQITGRDSLNRVYARYEKKGATFLPGTTEVYTYDRMNQLTEVDRDDFKKDTFFYYANGEMMWGAYGQPFTDPIQQQPDPDTDTTDNLDPFADYQPSETAEPEPPAPQANDGGVPAAPDFNQQMTANPERWAVYSMDKAGNRTLVTDANGNISYSPNNLNQYTGSVGAASISNGSEHEVNSYNGVNYTYINDEHLKQVTSGSNTYSLYYDALGRCVKRTLNPTNITTYYIYDGDKPVLEYKSGDLSHPARNLYGKGIDEILTRTDSTVNSGQPFYYMQDREGSVMQLFNASGNVIESYRYDAFGAPVMYNGGNTQIPSTGYNNRFLFTGREYAATYQKTYVSAFNFYEYRARAYNPTLGRFMSEDPKLFDAGDYNLFRYCSNDPLDLTDSMGTDGIPNGDGTYHFVLRSDIVVHDIVGRYVVDSQGNMKQCAGAAQFLTSTRTADGKLHDAPQAKNGGWHQGAPLRKETPNGTMVARGWKNGVYPNESREEAERNGSKILNHTGIKIGWDDKSNRAIILDQWKGDSGSLQKRPYDPNEGEWSVVNANKRYDPQPSRSNFNVDQALQKSSQEAGEKVGEAETGVNRKSQ